MTTPQPAALPELPKPTKAGHLIASCPVYQDIEVKRVQREAFDAGQANALATLQAQPAAGVSDAEWWHDVLGSAGPDLLNLAKQWSDNKVHVYQFANEAEKIVKAAAQRAILALRPQASAPAAEPVAVIGSEVGPYPIQHAAHQPTKEPK